MRVRNATELPDYLVIADPKFKYVPPPRRKEGKFTQIPVAANILGRENSYEHLNIPNQKYKMANGFTPYEMVMNKILSNSHKPQYVPVKLPQVADRERN